ncbi:hypothetical protein D3C73_768480 [compost metagenome]
MSAGATLTATPPTSLLWVISRDSSLSTTRGPKVSAALFAWASDVTVISRTPGMPNRANSALAWASSSEPRSAQGIGSVALAGTRAGVERFLSTCTRHMADSAAPMLSGAWNAGMP